MANNRSTKSLQVGEATEEASPVAAIIEMKGPNSTKLFFQGDYAEAIIDGLHQYQDLYCLCRMAPAMGTREDSNSAIKLEEFLSKDYIIDDFDNFDFPFSIGHIKCIGWAKGEDNCRLLKTMM